MSPRTIAVSFPISNTNTNYPGLPRLPVFGFHPFSNGRFEHRVCPTGPFWRLLRPSKGSRFVQRCHPSLAPPWHGKLLKIGWKMSTPLFFRGLSSEPLRESKKTLPAGFMFFHQKVQFELNPFRLGNDIQAEILPCCMLDASCSDFQPVEVKARSLGARIPFPNSQPHFGFFCWLSCEIKYWVRGFCWLGRILPSTKNYGHLWPGRRFVANRIPLCRQ